MKPCIICGSKKLLDIHKMCRECFEAITAPPKWTSHPA